MNRIAVALLVALVWGSPRLVAQEEAPPAPAVDESVELNNRGVELYGKERFDEAIGLFRRAIDLQRRRGEEPGPAIVTNLSRALLSKATRAIESSEPELALRALQEARSVTPQEPLVYAYFGVVQYREGAFSSAMDFLNDALARDEACAVAHEYQGMIHYKREALEQAIESWKRAIAADAGREKGLSGYLAKAQRELEVEAGMRQEFSSHFSCKFGDDQTRQIATTILRWLEDAYANVGGELREYPGEVLSVVLYGDREFTQATGAHRWAGGLFDGKIRIPVKDFRRNEKQIKATLIHEYAHFVVRRITRKCPAWLNEGIAQIFEGREARPASAAVVAAARAGRLPSVSGLEATFAGIADAAQARHAYACALSFTAFLVDQHRLTRIEQLLRALGRGEDFDAAFLDTYRRSLAEMESLWLEALRV